MGDFEEFGTSVVGVTGVKEDMLDILRETKWKLKLKEMTALLQYYEQIFNSCFMCMDK